jgi:hypothetical protein
MYTFTFPGGSTFVTDEEGAVYEEYLRRFHAAPISTHKYGVPHITVLLVGSNCVGKKAILDRVSRYESLHSMDVSTHATTQHYCGDPPRPIQYRKSLLHDGQEYNWFSKVNDHGCVTLWELSNNLSPYSNHLSGYQYLKKTVRDSHVCLLVYDVANRKSFEQLWKFHDDMQLDMSSSHTRRKDKAGTARAFDSNKPVYLLANKVDLPATSRVVTESEGRAFAARIYAKYHEISVKQDMGITEVIFSAIAYGLIHHAETEIPKLKEAETARVMERIKLAKSKMKEKYPYTYFLRQCRLDDTSSDDTQRLSLSGREFARRVSAKLGR